MRPILLTAVAFVLAFGGPVSADPAYSTAERKALPPAEADKLAQSDLQSVLTPPHGFQTGMLRATRAETFTTAAYGTDYQGLCRRDSLDLRYAPTTTQGKLEDAPVKPYGVESTAWFTDAGLADAPVEQGGQRGHQWTQACQDKGLDTAAWFSAKDADEAAEAILVFRKIRSELQAGTLKALPCDHLLEDKAMTCEAAILAQSHFTTVNACFAPAGQLCLELWADIGKEITVTFRRGAPLSPGDIGHALPGDILSIALIEYVVVT